jgi:hypothetical protein
MLKMHSVLRNHTQTPRALSRGRDDPGTGERGSRPISAVPNGKASAAPRLTGANRLVPLGLGACPGARPTLVARVKMPEGWGTRRPASC